MKNGFGMFTWTNKNVSRGRAGRHEGGSEGWRKEGMRAQLASRSNFTIYCYVLTYEICSLIPENGRTTKCGDTAVSNSGLWCP